MIGAESGWSGEHLLPDEISRDVLLEEKWLLLKVVILLLNNNPTESLFLHVCTIVYIGDWHSLEAKVILQHEVDYVILIFEVDLI